MRLSKEQLAEAVQAIYSGYLDGKTDEEVAADIGVDAEEFAKLRASMLDVKAEEIRTKPTEHVYVQYMIDQCRNLKDLTKLIEDFRTTKQGTAMVAAVKARSDIYDKLIKQGQEFGLIQKSMDSDGLGISKWVRDLTNRQLRATIASELKSLHSMVRKYGDTSIVDMDPGELHSGPQLPPAMLSERSISTAGVPVGEVVEKKTKRKKNAKVRNVRRHAGRIKAMPPGPGMR